MLKKIYRKEAIEYKKHHWKGKALLLAGLPAWLVALLSFAFLAILIATTVFCSFTQRIDVQGEVITLPHSVNVYAPQQGFVISQYVKVGDIVSGSVYNFTEQGAFIFTDERFIAFLDKREMTTKPRVGQTLTTRITFIRDDGRINVSMRPIKEKAINFDAQMLYDTLIARGGKMPYCDETASEVIRERFGISKSAFKRALGHLMKEGKVEQKDGWTCLISQE